MKTIKTSKSLNIEIDGRLYTVSLKDPRIKTVARLVEQRKKAELLSILNPQNALDEQSDGRIKIVRGEVLFNGRLANGPLAARIKATLGENGGAAALIKFADRLLANPSQRSADQAWRFLQNKHLPLLPNGNFLAYKGIKSNWTDCYTGTISQRIGEKVTMDRKTVLNNPKEHCGPGLHIGSLQFARGYGQLLIEVEVDPFDVVSVPEDSGCQKMRTCGYTPRRIHTNVAMHTNETEKALVKVDQVKKPFTIDETTREILLRVCAFIRVKLNGRAPRTQLAFNTHYEELKTLTGQQKRALHRLIFKEAHRIAFPELRRMRQNHHG